MGKYMKKGKITADVAVMELPQSPLGVRTRAKTLALQRLQSLPPSPDSESCYLQLRSRRLQKHPAGLHEDRKKSSNSNVRFAQKQLCPKDSDSLTCRKLDLESSSRLRVSSVHSSSVASASIGNSGAGEGCFQILSKGCESAEGCDLGFDDHFGENNLESDARERSTRESTPCTPCSLIREEGIIKTPSSTTRVTNPNTNVRSVRSPLRNMPSADEVNEFFAYAEQQQQRFFADKYNFDIVNDSPMPGRFDWVRVSQ
ncbi:unnamed protein product [Cuscuta epithymum]|uniref:Cyclin-dependent kinase inhibitor domain-containing protein n=1 Tax=Cuscuta epithymum TaxID=186058 RepID=A0AAV0CE97_9ASTE|nr:unnamed protein product [Cuscuta epithymum]